MFIPASQLPFKDYWDRIACDLPLGGVLFVVSEQETPMKQSMLLVASTLRARGRQIGVVTSDNLRYRRRW